MKILCLLLTLAPLALASKILVVVPISARSHIMLFDPLVLGLAERGHDVTYIVPQKLKTTLKNVEQIILPVATAMDVGKDDSKKPDMFEMRHMTPLHNMVIIPSIVVHLMEVVLESKQMQDFLKSDRKFDAVIAESFLCEGLAAGLAHKYKAPLIGYGPFMPSYWINYMVGSEAPTSYIPDPIAILPFRMSFTQRLWSAVFSNIANSYRTLKHLPTQDKLMRKYFGEDLPPVTEIITNTSLLFVNDHFSVSFPRPAVPNLVSIGGIHIKPPKPLPADLQKYLDNSKNGAILFSLGSNLKSADMGPEKIQLFLNAFAKLKQNVLWKFEVDLPNKPSNVLTSDWLPQSDILAHPNLKLFITHGGLLSTTESVQRAVPIVGIPIFGDQPMNMAISVNAGVGLSLDYDKLTEEAVIAAINEVINNPKYREATNARSATFKDVIVPPRDLAVWWVEYVIRHKGAPHLRSAALDLTWYERHQLDVYATIILIAFSVLYVVKITLCALTRKLCSKKTNSRTKKNN